MPRKIYLRTSTQEQNPQNQLEDCKKICSAPYEVVEEKQSAWKDKDRPKFEELKKQIKSRRVNHLYVWDWDRLHRNRIKLIEFFKFCKLYDCEIHSFRQQYFEDFYKIPAPWNDIVSDLVLNVMGHLAEEESKKKSERVKIAYQNRKGAWGRKALPYRIKKEILEKRKQGLSIREIADSVISYDKNRNEKYISKSYVHKILTEAKGGMS